jgi:hypothetical protein
MQRTDQEARSIGGEAWRTSYSSVIIISLFCFSLHVDIRNCEGTWIKFMRGPSWLSLQ